MDIIKRCNCGINYSSIPLDAVISKLGYWWNCRCRSTLFLAVDQVGSRSLKTLAVDKYGSGDKLAVGIVGSRFPGNLAVTKLGSLIVGNNSMRIS